MIFILIKFLIEIYYLKKSKTIPLIPEITRIILAFESNAPEELTCFKFSFKFLALLKSAIQ